MKLIPDSEYRPQVMRDECQPSVNEFCINTTNVCQPTGTNPNISALASTSRCDTSKIGMGVSRTFKAGDSNFISEFYNRSRLHHIATMSADFKRLVNELRAQPSYTFPGLDKLHQEFGQSCKASLKSKVLMHIDMDCFFVSCGLIKRPELIGI